MSNLDPSAATREDYEGYEHEDYPDIDQHTGEVAESIDLDNTCAMSICGNVVADPREYYCEKCLEILRTHEDGE